MTVNIKPTKTIVVSAVNLIEGGTLTVLRESLASAIKVVPTEWEIIALVHEAGLIRLPRVRIVEIPESKTSWLKRLYWEWFGFRKLSLQWNPELWLSLHDITPRVHARHQAVYCHNPAPFYWIRLREMVQEPKLLLFNLFYGSLYRLNIKRNRYVIVQQEWLRKEFLKRFGPLPMVVAHPSQNLLPKSGILKRVDHYIFLYPALSRVFKNFEIIGEAVELLQAKGIRNFEVRLTIDGTENPYSRWVRGRFGQLQNMRFLGLQSRDHMLEHYKEAFALLFPSRLETWGLPITEAKQHQLPMLVSELPYAHETVGEYDLVSFFDPQSPEMLANLMASMISGSWQPSGNREQPPCQPFAANWGELWTLLIEEQTISDDSKMAPVQIS